MRYRISNDAGEFFEMTEDPRLLKTQLTSAKAVLSNLVTNEASLLGKYTDLNSWNGDYAKEKQEAANAAAAASLLAQKKSDALAKLTSEDKQALGLS